MLGKKAKDKVTGFEGIITAKVEYLTGCMQYGIVPPIKDGQLQNAEYFDYTRVEILGDGVEISDVSDLDNPGGPNRDAPC